GVVNRGSRTINNNRTVYVTLAFLLEKPGEYKIPAFNITVGTKRVRLPMKKFKVWPAKLDYPEDKIIFSRVLFNGSEDIPDTIFPGQGVTIDYQVCYASDWRYISERQYQKFLPKFSFGDLKLKVIDHTWTRSPIYRSELQGSKIIGALPYKTHSYRMIAIPNRNGTFPISITHQAVAIKQKPGLPQPLQKLTPFEFKSEIKVRNIPLPSADLTFLGLIGNWNVKARLSKKEIQTAYPFEIIVEVKGRKGNLDRLMAPDLVLPGFEVDPNADIQKNRNKATIRYIVRALKPDAQLPLIKFATFNTKRSKFVSFDFIGKIKITGKVIKETVLQGQLPELKKVEEDEVSFLGPLSISRPLSFNIFPLWYLLFPFLPMIYILICWNKSQWSELSPEKKRRRLVLKHKKKLLKKLRSKGSDTIIEDEVIPYLAALYNLSPGLTADELSQHLSDKELANMLQKSSHASFLPDSSSGIDFAYLAQKLAKLSVVAFLFFGFSLQAQSLSDQAQEYYENEKYNDAADSYKKITEQNNGDVSAYSNLGSSLFHQEKYAHALAAYETAIRLMPGDKIIEANIELCLEKLGIKRDFGITDLRDSYRPDHWLQFSLILWATFWILLIIHRLFNIPGKRWTALSGAIIFLLSISMWYTQGQSRYRPGQAICHDEAKIYTDSEAKESNEAKLIAGQQLVIIQQTEQGMTQVLFDNEKVWVQSGSLSIFW
ncbi:MAG: BatD family protein, partial [Lentisphaeraceae bacterium]|nr:BatD family protein [Lentisphaeraceae bacterium]